jgi:hypothetical protein
VERLESFLLLPIAPALLQNFDNHQVPAPAKSQVGILAYELVVFMLSDNLDAYLVCGMSPGNGKANDYLVSVALWGIEMMAHYLLDGACQCFQLIGRPGSSNDVDFNERHVVKDSEDGVRRIIVIEGISRCGSYSHHIEVEICDVYIDLQNFYNLNIYAGLVHVRRCSMT